MEKSKKFIRALDITGEEDPSFTDEQNAAVSEAREFRELQKKILLEAGVFLEESKIVSLEWICRELKRRFKGCISRKFIDDFCPPEWKPKK